MNNAEWLELPVKVATPSDKLPVITSKMGICYCGEPCVCQIEDGQEQQYIHAISMVEECSDNPRNDPPT